MGSSMDNRMRSRGVEEFLTVLRRRWLYVVVVSLITLTAAAILTVTLKPQYTATVRLYFTVEGAKSVADLAQAAGFTQGQMASMGQVATSSLLLDRVIDQLSLTMTASDLAEVVKTSAPADTTILDIA